jgi:hypothetical protein
MSENSNVEQGTEKKAAGKAAGKKAAGKKVVKKAAGKKAAGKKAAAAEKGGLSGNQRKVLQALAKTTADKTLTRGELAEKTGIERGWSKLLGSPTKDAKDHGMEAEGLVKSQKVEGERGLGYFITAKGKAALAK